MATWTLPQEVVTWIAWIATPLHGRLAGRLSELLVGMLFAQGRRTVASWIRGGNLRPFSLYYYFLGSLGRKVEWIASLLLRLVVEKLNPGDSVLMAIDDTPTKRYGPKVQGAGIHHNPTPGPADQRFLYGHVWVTLSVLARHALWGCIGLPLRAFLYVREKDVPQLPRGSKVSFRTKLQMAADLIDWAAERVHWLGKKLRVVADGAYAKRPVFRKAKAKNATLISRLRKDAKLYDLPKPGRRGPGRPRIYGDAISLARRGAHPGGWQTGEFPLYGKTMIKTYKSFVATYPPAGGAIRVVIVREDAGWVAFFSTDVNETVAQILEAVADRSAIEQDFHDLKEVHGAGQQQVRNYWANVAVYHLNLWLHTLIELWAWARPHAEVCDRSQSPWDNPQRRPSHADRRNALRRSCLQREYSAAQAGRPISRKLRTLLNKLVRLVA